MSFFYKLLEKFAQMLVPTGAILPFIGTEVPEGFILWQEYKIYESQLPKLYARYSTVENFTKGSDSTGNYVQLPSINDRTLQACSSFSLVGKLLAAALPNIIGSITSPGTCGGAFSLMSEYKWLASGSSHQMTNKWFNAGNYSAIYKEGAGLQPAAAQTLMIIKV